MPYNAVILGPGTAEEQRTETLAVLLALTPDELLKPFRERSGKPAPGRSIGGWYDAHAYCPGHTFGQWLSAFARSYAISGEPELKQHVHTLVSGLGNSFDATGSFFGGDNRFPAYTLEKLNCGLIDALSFAHDPDAATILHDLSALAMPHLPEKALSRAEQRNRTTRDITYTYDESYTLPENYFLAFQRTGETYFRDLALRFMHTSFLEPLAAGENVLPGLHAYSHVNALNSAAQAFLVTGDERSLLAAENGFRFVQAQSYASGGWGPTEAFITPGRGELAASLQRTHNSFETPCGAYGHFKIARSLLSITGDGRYGDSMEQVLYNTVLGSLPLQPDGRSFYYSDYSPGGTKVYHATRWPCCSGTLAQVSADYRISAYLRGERGLVVNLYLPSKVRWQEHGTSIEVEQSGSYPLEEEVTFHVRPSQRVRLALSFRVPAWTGGTVAAKVNGRTVVLPQPRKGFITLDRLWHRDDVFTLRFPLPLRLQPIAPESQHLVALMRGPVVLYAKGGPFPAKAENLLAAKREEKAVWLVQSGASRRSMTSFDRLGTDSYTTYHDLASM